MPLLASYKRKKYFLTFAYLSGIIIIITIFYNLLQFQPIDLLPKNLEHNSLTQSYKDSNSENYELTLHNLTFKGINKDLEPYVINATKADKITESTFNLEEVKANYEFGNNKLLINAKSGLLDNLTNLMDLRDDVQILLDNLILNTNEIRVNLITKEALSNAQIEMIYKNSQIKADSFTSTDNSNIINFKGNVLTRINIGEF